MKNRTFNKKAPVSPFPIWDLQTPDSHLWKIQNRGIFLIRVMQSIV